MNEPLEDRLRRYGPVLDRASEIDESAAGDVVTVRPALPRRRQVVAIGTATAVAAVAMVVIGFTGGDNQRREVVGAAHEGPPLQRTADGGFPRLLIDGWQVTRADESAGPMSDDSSKRYHHAEAVFARDGAELELTMDEGDAGAYDALVDDRVASADERREATVLGQPATITRYRASRRYAAMWFADQVVYELDGDVGGEDAFMDAVDALRVVRADDWEAALPDSSVAPRERPAEVDRMLADIPQPPGFDAAGLRRRDTAVDRYQLGAKVAGSVACGWIDRWVQARRTGDEAAEREAVHAMNSSRNWRVLNEMNADGDYPEVLWQYADAMASGGTIEGGRPMSVEESAGHGLGCPNG
jgi:hypothetical protein